MTSFEAKVIANRRITIPRYLAEELGIHEGDYVQVNEIRKLEPVKEANSDCEGCGDPVE